MGFTLGHQIIKNFQKNYDEKGPEVREVTLEYAKKDFLPRLEKIIKEEARFFKGKFYIQVFGYGDPMTSSASHIRVAVRQSRPGPEWNCLLYSYDKEKDELKYEWMVPTQESSEKMLENPEGWHPHLIYNISQFKKGKLV